jgi:hypothetical protein
MLHLIAAGLSARNLPIRYTHDQEEGLLRITGLAGRYCTVIADDSSYVLVDCWPAGPPAPRAAALAATAMRIVGDHDDWRPGDPVSDPDLTLLSRVGLALRAAGLTVRLNVLADEKNLEVFTQITVTHPRRPERGQLRIGDDGTITWECDHPHSADQQHHAAHITNMLAIIAGAT